MNIFFLISSLLPVAVLLAVGIAIRVFKAYWLISGYNTMSPEKKEKVDVDSLGKLTGNMCFAIAAIILLSSIFFMLKLILLAGIIFAMLVPVIVYSLVKAQKYDLNTKRNDGKMKTSSKAVIIIVVVFFLIIAVGVGFMLNLSSKPAGYILSEDSLKISGLYGETIKITEIGNLSLKDYMPEILTKSNGSGLGSMMKGYFKVKDLGNVKLFVDTSKKAFIYFEKQTRLYIINSSQDSETKALYKNLEEKLKSIGK